MYGGCSGIRSAALRAAARFGFGSFSKHPTHWSLVAAAGRRPTLRGLRLNAQCGSLFVVSQPPKYRRPGPPQNPGVRELVDGKRRWSSPPSQADSKQGFRGWHERGYLPHRDEPGLTQFVTFRLIDSFPESLRSEWEHLVRIEDDRERRAKLEAYLDKGQGDCHLRRPDVAQVVESNFRDFSSIRYELRAWVVMPNHVHILFKVGNASMSEIVGAWKKHTGRIANGLLQKRGAFWAEDYFDVFMRDQEHERRTVRYIEMNPPKAKLALDPKKWQWSSARFRDEFGRLKM
jgi:REP element-mobilizing transposase RayT